jgi:hypothetical protein
MTSPASVYNQVSIDVADLNPFGMISSSPCLFFGVALIQAILVPVDEVLSCKGASALLIS